MDHRLRTGLLPYCDRLLVDDIENDINDIKNSDLGRNQLIARWMKVAIRTPGVSALIH